MKKLCALLLFTLTSHLHAQVFETTLNNGLTVLIKPDHRAPIAIVMTWYNVGSADEVGGLTGLSHALEHMMFKGTPSVPMGMFSKMVAEHGGQDNAFTNQDYTAYYEKISTKALDMALKLEADRMRNLLLTEQEFSKEIKVIREERRMRVEDNPQSLALERFMATAYLTSAYQHPVIGWMSDLMHLNIQELRTWYNKYYAPNNATLVIVGDVDPQNVLPQIEHYFGSIPKHVLPARYIQEEPISYGQKQVTVTTQAQQPILLLGYTTPSLGYLNFLNQSQPNTSPASTADAYALEVIAGLLDAGENGRLTKTLIHTQHLAATVNAYYDLYTRYQTQFMLFAIPTQAHTTLELKQALLNEVHQLQKTLVLPQELKRVQTQLIAQDTFGQDSLFSQAMKLGLVTTIGLNHRIIDDYKANILAVTPQQILDTANTYFRDDFITETVLYPQSINKAKS
jgi:zinc protease